jgi:Fe-Mn family superoxide dismutase
MKRILYFVALIFVQETIGQQVAEHKPGFVLGELPYSVEALEPFIDKETMTIHFNKHHASYVNNLNTALLEDPYLKEYGSLSLEGILLRITEDDAVIRNNAGGHYNHELFWRCLTPNAELRIPSDRLMQSIKRDFGSIEKLKELLMLEAKNRFGSGWVWLCKDLNGVLFVISTPNQDNPLMAKITKRFGIPILGIDVWEHAYYLKYQNKRPDYVKSILEIVNWQYVSERYEKDFEIRK